MVFFCKICLEIFKNCKSLTENSEFDSNLSKFTPLANIDNEFDTCYFCHGILSKKIENEILKRVLELKNVYEFNDFKLTTNFSPLFTLIHTLLKVKFRKDKDNNQIINLNDLDFLEFSLIRKVIKPSILPKIENLLGRTFEQKSKFEIKLIFEFEEAFYTKMYKSFEFMPFFRKFSEKKFKPQSLSLDRGQINEFMKSCSSDLFEGIFDKEKLLSSAKLDFKLEIVNENIFLKGSYCKFSRDIGQTPWVVDGQRICLSSVEEEMKKTLKILFNSDDCILHAGGREDRDVRMLNSGRPFLIEITNPKKIKQPLENIQEIQNLVNSNTEYIKVKELDLANKNYLEVLKKYEDSKKKLYSCVVWTNKTIDENDLNKIDNVKNMDIIQKTPLRVLHRRALMDRKKMILSLKSEKINENFIIVHVLASAGTYIKEFIHGDLGRTVPNLGSILGTDCDILQLDVLDIIWDEK